MAVHRTKSSQRASPDVERLVADAISLAASGSQIEDRFWEARLDVRLMRLLKSQNQNVIDAALDQTFRINTLAFEVLADCAETLAESLVLEHEGEPWDVLLLALPIIAHTRYQIPSGALSASAVESTAAALHQAIASTDTRLAIIPWLYSIDQMPHSHCQTRLLTEALATAAITASEIKLELREMSETIAVLADPRFIIAAIAAPSGTPLFRWQAEPPIRQERGVSLTGWQNAMRDPVAALLPGCEFELLLPEAYFTNCRLADKQVRPLSMKAAVNFLESTLGVLPAGLSCVVGAFGEEQADEYRISFSVKGSAEVVYGVIWPLYDRESVSNDALNDLSDDDCPMKRITDALRDAGVEDVFRHAMLFDPELCDDCGAPLFPDRSGEAVHAELPDDAPTQQPLFH
ncbi:hypothetical protein TUM22923_09030 [Polynucleobacter sp. TUM22923]|jgi:hypothetical protein|uniref:DUF2863 family protein n=1 Tax=Polynucleobacter sp. TUM22923 TaxID=3022126 RepID=UPI0025724FC9|nr:DUF2863 family protein [Polynucleobacter sp. TUM22923]BDX21582.1 hypothetical protein TUM22923_09030 [Polynucleobacter sp. TUM22923]